MKAIFAGAFVLCMAVSAIAQPRAIQSTPNIWHESSTTATGTSTAFNPAISVNGLFLGFYASDPFGRGVIFGGSHEEDEHHEHEEGGEYEDHHAEENHAHGLPEDSGLSVQEVEVRFASTVDAYFRADLTLAIPGTSGLEIEGGILETTGLPNVTLKFGKFYGEFGKHNNLHTHAYPFIDPPVVHERLFGGEGLNEVGVSASFLLPTAWYAELTPQILNVDPGPLRRLWPPQTGHPSRTPPQRAPRPGPRRILRHPSAVQQQPRRWPNHSPTRITTQLHHRRTSRSCLLIH